MEQRRLGFTLVELLIAVTIFSLMAVALYSSFNAGIKVWRRAEENMELNQAVRLSLEGLAKELRNAIDFTEEEEPEESAEEKSEEEAGLTEKPDLAFSGTANGLSFVTLIDRLSEKEKFVRELAKVGYSLDGDGGFVRTAAFQSEGFAPPLVKEAEFSNTDSDKEVLVDSVEELKFEYSYQGEEEDSPPVWKDIWEDQKGIPLGVKIHLKVKRKEGVVSDFSKTVFIPTGILGKEAEEGLNE